MSDLVLAAIDRGGDLLAAVRWAVLREAVGGTERALVLPVDRRGMAAARAVAAKVAAVAPPPGQSVAVQRGARREHGLLVDRAGTIRGAAGVVPTNDTTRAYPCGILGEVPGAPGPATAWARDVGAVWAASSPRQFALRWAVEEYRARWEGDGLGGASWVDVVQAPHQIAVVRAVLTSPSVRHILADEVGLGKTIEALMIWSALSTEDPSLRTLVACPKSLVPQWTLEVRRRTERSPRARRWEDVPPIYVRLGDQVIDRLDAPNTRGIIVTDHEGMVDLADREAPVDLLIVDEAHTLTERGQKAASSLAGRALHALLLTATPRESARQKGAARAKAGPFAWAISVVDPKCAAAGRDLASVERQLAADLAVIAEADRAVASGAPPGDALVAAARAGSGGASLTAAALVDARALVREATLMERVVRTRRRQIPAEQTPQRRLIRVPIEYRAEEVAVFRALGDFDGEADARARVRRLASSGWAALAGGGVGLNKAARERLGFVREARVDAKLEALLDLCGRLWREDPTRKVVIRCEYTATLDLVFERLRGLLSRGALRPTTAEEITAWNGGGEDVVGPVARLDGGEDSMIEALANTARAKGSMLAHVAAFERQSPGAAVVLVARDVAAVGLNLQFARDLIFYDVPWKPGLAEQWIGRLDRLGQRAGEVSVYALAHPDAPSDGLLDLYESLRLFDSGLRGAAELDDQVSRLIGKADSDELTWQEVRERAARLLAERDDDEDGGRSLDLPPFDGALRAEDERAAGERLLRALRAEGFEATEDGPRAELRWPARDRDAVELGEVRARLRSGQTSTTKATPEKLAMLSEESPVLRVDTLRLAGARWSRGWSVDFLTPRHPLVVEAAEELGADPTLAVGCFATARPSPTWSAGTYLIALARTFPSAAGAALTWGTAALAPCPAGDPAEDDELRRTFQVVTAGLRRACAAYLPPRVELFGWHLRAATPAAASGRSLAGNEVTALVAALQGPGTRRIPDPGCWQQVSVRLAEIEATAAAGDAELGAVARAAADARRYVNLFAPSVLAPRVRQVAASSGESGMRGIKEFHQRRLDLARSFFERLASLDAHSATAAREAVTPRVIAAALLEARP